MKKAIVGVILLALTSSCGIVNYSSNKHGHHCRYQLCPYKGLYRPQWKAAVIEYTQEEDGSIPVAIDMLHLNEPKWTYEKIARAIGED